jgi:hypothetical protein
VGQTIAVGGLPWGSAAADDKNRSSAPPNLGLLLLGDVRAAVLLPARFIMIVANGPILAVADGP